MSQETIENFLRLFRMLFLLSISGIGAYLALRFREKEHSILLLFLATVCLFGVAINSFAFIYYLFELFE